MKQYIKGDIITDISKSLMWINIKNLQLFYFIIRKKTYLFIYLIKKCFSNISNDLIFFHLKFAKYII